MTAAEHDGTMCADPWCPAHAVCGSCRTPVIILDDEDPAFCPTCLHDVMPQGACARATDQPANEEPKTA